MYCKQINLNHIVCIGIDIGGIEITEAEYNAISDIIHNKPIAESGYEHRLRADTLEWELYELPEPEPIDDELTAEEALNIITGGTE